MQWTQQKVEALIGEIEAKWTILCPNDGEGPNLGSATAKKCKDIVDGLNSRFIPHRHTLALTKSKWSNLKRDSRGYRRDRESFYYSNHPIQIGGDGVVVEIDETVLTKRKYHRGALRAEQQWFFGGVERGSGRCFLVPVERRDAATFIPIIQRYIIPGATINSDMWAAYNRIDELPEMYEHYTVNHSENFVDPEDGTHTETIEGTWHQFKRRHRGDQGTARTLFAPYIDLFIWRKDFKSRDVMFHLWTQMKEQYPVD